MAATPILDRLLAAGPPLQFTDWSLDPAALERVLELIADGRERVAECGSGVSTIVIARLLAARGHGRIESLEHDRAWAREVAGRIEAERLSEHARVVEAPLRPQPLAEPCCGWYDPDAVATVHGPIDLLLVDGPPANEPAVERSRYPALPALCGRLAPGAVVILDDAQRPGEAWVLGRWARETGARFESRPADRIAIGCMFPPESPGGPGRSDTERKE